MSLSFPNLRLFHPTAPRHNERPPNKNLILLLPLIHQGHEQTLQNFLKAYIRSFRGQTDISLVLYMPEPHYDIETLEQWLTAEGAPETQPDIELMLDPMLVSAEPELYLNTDVVIALEADMELILKALALNRQVFSFYTLPHTPVKTLKPDTLSEQLKKIYAERTIKTHTRPWVLNKKQQQLLSVPGQDLIYTPSQRHLEHLGNLVSGIILTDDFETFYTARDRDLPCCLIQAFLPPEFRAQSKDWASQIASEWHQSLLNIEYSGQNIIENAQYDLWYTFRSCMDTAEAFGHILNTLKPRSIILFDEFTQAHFWDPAFGPFPDPQNAVFAFIADARGIPWKKIPPPARGPIRSQYPPSSHAAIPSEKWFLDLEAFEQLKPRYKHIILSLGSHIDLEEQGLIAQHFWSQPDTLYVFLRLYPFPVSHPNALFLDIDFFLQDAGLENNLETLRSQLLSQWQNAQIAMSENRVDIANRYPFLFKNTYLHFQFEQFFKQAIEAARYIHAANTLVKLLSPHLCLFGNTAGSGTRGFLKAIKNHTVPTCSIMHARNTRSELRCETDLFFVKGQDIKSALTATAPSSQIFISGDLRLAKPNIQTSTQHIPHYLQKKNKRPTILLLTNQISYGLYLGHETEVFSRAWDQLITLIKAHPEWFFMIKSHPRYDHPGFYKNLETEMDNLLCLDPGLSYQQLAPEVDIAMMVNRYSTVIYEVYASQKPLILFSDIPQNIPCCIPADSKVAAQKIQRLLTDTSEYQTLLTQQSQYLAQEWSPESNSSFQNIMTILAQQLPHDANRDTGNINQSLWLAQAFSLYKYTKNQDIWMQARKKFHSKIDISYYDRYFGFKP